MRTAFKVLVFALAAEVVVQAMAIAYALAGLGKWIEDDGGILNKAAMDSQSLHFRGVGGFAIHGINGMMIIPILALLMLIASFFSKVAGASKRAGILFAMVAVQVVLGMTLHSVPAVAPLHALNGFALFLLALSTGLRLRAGGDLRRTGRTSSVDAPRVAVPVA